MVVLYRVPGAREVHGVALPAGTMTVGYFWTARPFNLYHWVGPDGRTLAHYFNVGDVTRLEGDLLEWHDLAVDVLATPDGRVQVLDEDELPPDLDPALRRYVEAARDRILRDLPDLIAESEARSAEITRSLAGQCYADGGKVRDASITRRPELRRGSLLDDLPLRVDRRLQRPRHCAHAALFSSPPARPQHARQRGKSRRPPDVQGQGMAFWCLRAGLVEGVQRLTGVPLGRIEAPRLAELLGAPREQVDSLLRHDGREHARWPFVARVCTRGD